MPADRDQVGAKDGERIGLSAVRCQLEGTIGQRLGAVDVAGEQASANSGCRPPASEDRADRYSRPATSAWAIASPCRAVDVGCRRLGVRAVLGGPERGDGIADALGQDHRFLDRSQLRSRPSGTHSDRNVRFRTRKQRGIVAEAAGHRLGFGRHAPDRDRCPAERELGRRAWPAATARSRLSCRPTATSASSNMATRSVSTAPTLLDSPLSWPARRRRGGRRDRGGLASAAASSNVSR